MHDPAPVPTPRLTHVVDIALPAPSSYSDVCFLTVPEDCGDADAWARAEVLRRRGDQGWLLTVRALRPRVTELSTETLAIGDDIEVLVKMSREVYVTAKVVWRSAVWFVATSERFVHRGYVTTRLADLGLAYCEAFEADLEDLPTILAFAERELRGDRPRA